MRRIWKIEELVSAARKKHFQTLKAAATWPTHARRHATAVAALVLAGQPRIDEPLKRAWARALQHYGIDIKNGQIAAAERLYPTIKGSENEAERFAEIFRTAPVWLLQFTGMTMDAGLLGFQLPDVSRKLTWGSDGYEDARRWPSIPSGMMTAGDAIPDGDERRFWVTLFCTITVDFSISDLVANLGQEDQEIRSDRDEDPLMQDLFIALDLDRKPENEWSRYEKRRMRKLSERTSRSC